MKKQIILSLAILTAAILYALPIFAQPTLPPPGAAPIDGGLSLLVAAGVGYGVKKIREKRKNKADGTNQL